jgi:hypothetical protein
VTLSFCRDLTAADWVVHSDLPWTQLVCFGPGGFESYARIRFLPDPTGPGQRESDADPGWRTDQEPALLEVLAGHTATPEDCWFCVWEGFGQTGDAVDGARYGDGDWYADDDGAGAGLARPDAWPGWQPSPSAAAGPTLPKVVVPHRAYWLFRGPLADIGGWDTAQGWPGHPRLDRVGPAFVWPADHAWCLARDVDPHWAGIGGTTALVTRLLSDPRLDVVAADPGQAQPAYR